jgi:hypothetical protein
MPIVVHDNATIAQFSRLNWRVSPRYLHFFERLKG